MTSYNKLDYRFLLMKELEQRQQKNAAYSLRAFARTLDISPAYISQIFSGKRVLSETAATFISQKLRWPAKRKKLFLTLLQYQKAPNQEAKDVISSQIQDLAELDFIELKQDQFQTVADWYHFAIVELSDLEEFRPEPKWVARRLGLSIDEATAALLRLVRVGLLKEKEGRLKRSSQHHRIQDVPSQAIRAFHLSHLRAAEKALLTQSFESRDFSGTCVSISLENLPEIKELIRDFRSKINQYCSANTAPNAVYHLAVQFFRLDQEF